MGDGGDGGRDWTELASAFTVLFFAVVGVCANVACLYRLRRHSSVFHRFLKCLAIFDLLVVLGCLWMYSLPVLSPGFYKHVFLPTVPVVLPVVQIALMASVYATIVMSMERFLRLCRFQVMSQKQANVSLAFVVLFPILFYLPKFFEYRYVDIIREVSREVNCTEYALSSIKPGGLTPSNSTLNTTHLDLSACSQFNFTEDSAGNDTFMRIITFTEAMRYPQPTALRRNPLYYQIYCIGLNAVFASFFPLVLLLYFNLRTLGALFHGRNLFCGKCGEEGDEGSGGSGEGGKSELRRESSSRTPTTSSMWRARNPRKVKLEMKWPSASDRSDATSTSNNRAERDRKGSRTEEQQPLNSAEVVHPAPLALPLHSFSSKKANRKLTSSNCAIAGSSVCAIATSGSSEFNRNCTGTAETNLFTGEDMREGVLSHFSTASASGAGESVANKVRAAMAAARHLGQLGQRDSVTSYKNLLKKKENRLTRIALTIVWLFIFCHCWKLVPTVYELIYSEDGTEMVHWPQWLVRLKHLSHSLITLNSAVNFLIYSAL